MSNVGRVSQAMMLVLSAALVGCSDGPTDGVRDARRFGPEVSIGQGTARTYVTLDNDEAVEIGIELTESALNGLPSDGHGMYEYVLAMPANHPTPFKHVTVDWNAFGHEPDGIYNRSHFDFHFYTIPDAERKQILPSDPAFATKAANFPTAEFIPAGYIAPDPAAVPMMGVHWVDPTSPELNGQIFSRTFIYGSYDGKMIFVEPMITKAFLETKPNAVFEIPTAQRYTPSGPYPKAYAVRYIEATRRYEIALVNLVHRN